MKHLLTIALLGLSGAMLAIPTPVAAQQRTRSTCSCESGGAQIGFSFESRWDRSDEDNWQEIITVREVLPDTPAAGTLQEGDIIVRVNGLIATSQLFWSLRRTLVAGDTVRFRVRRGDDERELTLSIADE